jgi:hypothetical protein
MEGSGSRDQAGVRCGRARSYLTITPHAMHLGREPLEPGWLIVTDEPD